MIDVPEETQAEIRDHYDHGRGSIQDYARIYKLDMSDVLEIVGETDLGTVEIGGDLVDAKEMGGRLGAAEIRGPQTQEVPFDLK